MDQKKTSLKALLGMILVTSLLTGMVSGAPTLETKSYYGTIDPCNNTDNYQFVSDSLNVTDFIQLDYLGGDAPSYENFTEYTRGWDSPQDLFNNDTHIEWVTWDRTDEGAVYYANRGGLDAIGGTAYFKLVMTYIENNAGGTILMYPVVFGQGTYPDWREYDNGNYEAIGLQIDCDLSTSDDYTLRISELENSDKYSTIIAEDCLDVGTPYYITFSKSGTTLNCTIYSDPSFSSQLYTGEHTMQADHAGINDLMAVLAHDGASGARESSGYITELTFDEPGGGYNDTGYVQSLELINVNGSLKIDSFAINASIPTGSAVEVRFYDNSSWTSWAAVSDGYTMIDLRYLDGIDSITYEVRLNSTGATTPTVYESRVLAEGAGTLAVAGGGLGLTLLSAVIAFILGANRWRT